MSRRGPKAPIKAPEFSASIPSREAILKTLEHAAGPLEEDLIAERMSMSGEAALEGLARRLRAMVRDGQLVQNRVGRFGIARRMQLLAGRVIGHPDGFAFVRPDDGDKDVYLDARQARRVLHGDRVLVRIAGIDHRQRPFGAVTEVLARANTEVVGRFFKDGGVGYVVPDNRAINQDLLIPAGDETGARHGQIVVAEITQQPDMHCQPIARVRSVLGDHMAPGMEVEIAIRAHGLPSAFSLALEEEAARVSPEVTEAERSGRVDLRDLPFVTIDGADARDFDDAVFCRKTADGYRLLVAIADVAHYVGEGSTLDAEAYERGTSVYFPDRVIPMLPEALSNGICSLKPEVERLALVCELSLAEDGSPRKSRFYNAVIRSQARLVYEEVAAWFGQARTRGKSIQNQVLELHGLYLKLRERREERGALDIDQQEPRFIYNAARKIDRIESRERNDAHRLIEECMILANVAAAEYLQKHRLPALYRVHATPDGDRLEALRTFLGELGLSLPGGEAPTARDFATVLGWARGRPDQHLIETVLLRSMKLAVYRGENAGHFGLALDAYTHFTSPIRRYPDLVVHRAIKRRLARLKPAKPDAVQHAQLAEHTSMTERRADDATREAVAWLKCEFMQEKVGRRFEGMVSSVTSFGLFVQLDEIFVEGLVHVTALPDDYYQFDAVGHRLRGRRSGREFRIGQRVRVAVVRVNLDERQIDFELVDGPAARRGKARR